MMINPTIFTLMFFIFIRPSVCASNIEGETNKIYEKLKDTTVDKNNTGDTVVRWLSPERIAHEKTNKEKIDAEKDKNESSKYESFPALRERVDTSKKRPYASIKLIVVPKNISRVDDEKIRQKKMSLAFLGTPEVKFNGAKYEPLPLETIVL